MNIKIKLGIVIAALTLTIPVVGYFSMKHGIDLGIVMGVDHYHQICLIGGTVVDEINGTAIQCYPLSKGNPA